MLKRRNLKVLAAVALLLIMAWLAVSAFVAWRLTRRGSGPFVEQPPVVAGDYVESIRLKTCDNQQIGGWLKRGDADKPCVLLLHGFKGSRNEMLPVMEWLAESRFTVLAISLRAHGDSTGEVNDIGWSTGMMLWRPSLFCGRNSPSGRFSSMGDRWARRRRFLPPRS